MYFLKIQVFLSLSWPPAPLLLTAPVAIVLLHKSIIYNLLFNSVAQLSQCRFDCTHSEENTQEQEAHRSSQFNKLPNGLRGFSELGKNPDFNKIFSFSDKCNRQKLDGSQ